MEQNLGTHFLGLGSLRHNSEWEIAQVLTECQRMVDTSGAKRFAFPWAYFAFWCQGRLLRTAPPNAWPHTLFIAASCFSKTNIDSLTVIS